MQLQLDPKDTPHHTLSHSSLLALREEQHGEHVTAAVAALRAEMDEGSGMLSALQAQVEAERGELERVREETAMAVHQLQMARDIIFQDEELMEEVMGTSARGGLGLVAGGVGGTAMPGKRGKNGEEKGKIGAGEDVGDTGNEDDVLFSLPDRRAKPAGAGVCTTGERGREAGERGGV